MSDKGGPTNLESGTIVRVKWVGLLDKIHIIWGVISEGNQRLWGKDIRFHIILDSDPDYDDEVGDETWALHNEDKWRVGKRPPKEFWANLAKWRLTQ